MDLQPITIEALTTVAGLALVAGLVVALIQRPLNLSGAFMDRFGAVLSVVVACVLAIVADMALNVLSGSGIVQDLLNGLVAGLAASGGYDALNGAGKALAARSGG